MEKTEQKSIAEQAFEAAIARAAEQNLRELGREALRDYERSGPVELSPELTARVEALLRAGKRATARHRRWEAVRTHARQAAAVLLVVVALFTITYYQVDAFRTGVNNVIAGVSDGVSELIIIAQNAIVPGAAGMDVHLPEYIPAGFELDNENASRTLNRVCYVRGDDWIQFEQQAVVLGTKYHDAGDDFGEINTEINGFPGRIATGENGISSVLWYTGNSIMFKVATTLSVDEAVKTAESVIIR